MIKLIKTQLQFCQMAKWLFMYNFVVIYKLLKSNTLVICDRFSVSADMLEVKEPAILVEFENVPIERIGRGSRKKSFFSGPANKALPPLR